MDTSKEMFRVALAPHLKNAASKIQRNSHIVGYKNCPLILLLFV
jgi:hypothetical protein